MHHNSFDKVRLLLATLVIVGHSWGMLGLPNPIGAFGGAEIGEIAVCGFFSLSGYLVSKSWRRLRGPGFIWNRLLRLLPGFAASFWISLLVVGALGAADTAAYFRGIDWPSTWQFFFALHGPGNQPATFPGQAAPVTNGSMWTIQFEAFCYLLTPLLCLNRSATIIIWSAALAMAAISIGEGPTIAALPRLIAAYASGVLIADFRIVVGPKWIAIAGAALAPLLLLPWTWDLAACTLGAAVVIGLGQRPSRGNLVDVSYGTYLYAWPIQNLLIKAGIGSPILLLLVAIPLSWAAGWISWVLVEKWPQQFKWGAQAPLSQPVQADHRPVHEVA